MDTLPAWNPRLPGYAPRVESQATWIRFLRGIRGDLTTPTCAESMATMEHDGTPCGILGDWIVTPPCGIHGDMEHDTTRAESMATSETLPRREYQATWTQSETSRPDRSLDSLTARIRNPRIPQLEYRGFGILGIIKSSPPLHITLTKEVKRAFVTT
jgi:hypothetical protein